MSPRFRLASDADGAAAHVVEVLAEGQQAVAYGRHPSGVDYEWQGGVGPDNVSPAELPLATPEALRRFRDAAGERMRGAGGVEVGAAQEAAAPSDQAYVGDGNPAHRAGVLALLEEAGLVLKHRGETTDIMCPFADEHPDRAETGTALLSGGGICCKHATCGGRGQDDFVAELKKRVQDAGGDPARIYQVARDAKKRDMARDEFAGADKATCEELFEDLKAGKAPTVQDAQRLLSVPGKAQVDEFLASAGGLPSATVASLAEVVAQARTEAAVAAQTSAQTAIPPSARGRSSQTDALLGLGRDCRLDQHLRLDEATKTYLLVGVVPGSQVYDQLGLKGMPRLYADPLGGRPVYQWRDEMLTAAQVQLEALGVFVTEAHAQKAISAIASRNRFSAVREYLRGAAWDGIPRLDGWLERHSEADPTAFNRIALRKWMIGAVARALFPEERAGAAAQMDTVLTLAGRQGTRKSSFFRRLCPVDAWHTENALGDISSKDAVMRISSAWIVDLAEGASVKASEVEALKQFITATADNIRLPYGRAVTREVRRCAFGMTVNPDGVGFLKDGTGNRRFWIVEVDDIDIDLLAKERDQLWAEAVHAFDAGERWWLDPKDQADALLIAEGAAVAEGHRSQTGTEEMIRRYITDAPRLDTRNRITWTPRATPLAVIPALSDAMNALGLDISNPIRYREARGALTADGWVQTRVKLTHAPVARDKTVWVSRDGARALKADKKSNGTTVKFARWLDAQHAAAGIDEPPGGSGTGTADFAA